MFILTLKYIKYAWIKERKSDLFNPGRFFDDVVAFMKYIEYKENIRFKPTVIFSKLFIIMMFVAIVSVAFKAFKVEKANNEAINKATATEQSQPIITQVDSEKIVKDLAIEKAIKDFVVLNEGTLGKFVSYEKDSDSSTFLFFKTTDQPYVFTIKIENGKVLNEYLNLKMSDYSYDSNINKDGTINKKSFNYAIKTINKLIDEKASSTKFQAQFDAWNGSNIYLVYAVKKVMDDPSSFEHVSTSYYFDKKDNNIIHVTMNFRGNNKFGALVLNAIRAKIDSDGNILDYVWN